LLAELARGVGPQRPAWGSSGSACMRVAVVLSSMARRWSQKESSPPSIRVSAGGWHSPAGVE